EVLLDRGDKETAASILRNYFGCLEGRDADPRRKTATGLGQLADLFAEVGGDLMPAVIRKVGETLGKESDPELQSLVGAALVRLSSEASSHKQFGALNELCITMEALGKQRPVLVTELRPRIGIENRLPEWNRFYHDVVVRQVAYGAAHDRGRSLLELLEILDPLVVPQAIDEIGMSGDRTAVPPLIVMAEAGEAQGRSPLLQLKAVESLGRLREPDAVPVLRGLLEAKKVWKWTHHKELRIAAAQALAKIDTRYGSQIMSDTGLETGELAIGPKDSRGTKDCDWDGQLQLPKKS